MHQYHILVSEFTYYMPGCVDTIFTPPPQLSHTHTVCDTISRLTALFADPATSSELGSSEDKPRTSPPPAELTGNLSWHQTASVFHSHGQQKGKTFVCHTPLVCLTLTHTHTQHADVSVTLKWLHSWEEKLWCACVCVCHVLFTGANETLLAACFKGWRGTKREWESSGGAGEK